MSASAIAPPTAGRLPITAYIGAKTFTRSEVLAWEGQRARKALKRLGVPTPGGDVEHGRAAARGRGAGHARPGRGGEGAPPRRGGRLLPPGGRPPPPPLGSAPAAVA